MAVDPADAVFADVKPGSYKRIGRQDNALDVLLGAVALLFTWSTWIAGVLSPFYVTSLLLHGRYILAVTLAIPLIASVTLPVPAWPAFVRFVLKTANWFRGGAVMMLEEEMLKEDITGASMLCMHPHGIFCQSFILNGAARVHTRRLTEYVPASYQHISPKCTGVAEPLLFKIPLIRLFLMFFTCAEPASKKGITDIFRRKVPFGILVGGSEEIILAEYQKENIYIKNRKGFIKYALQHGYSISIGYNFGENDLYHTFPYFQSFRLWLLKTTKIPLFCAWGKWWCPLLPNNDRPLVTVIGNPFHPPKIPEPTAADIDKWHAVYVEKLVDLFERNKARFGYGDRKLHLY